jgi:hypothetical protein
VDNSDILVMALVSLAALSVAYFYLPSLIPAEEYPGFTKPESCGNGVCDLRVDGYPAPQDQYDWDEESVEENHINCPEECTQMPELDAIKLQPLRPVVSGIRMNPTSGRTLGYVTRQGNSFYIITAGHCLSFADRYNITEKFIGMVFEQGHERLGRVVRVPKDYWVDVALIGIDQDVEAAQMTALGHMYSGFGEPYAGQRVMKVGATTGLTYGVVESVRENYFWECPACYPDLGRQLNFTEMKIIPEGSYFSRQGDSGSAVLSADTPHTFLGVLTTQGSGFSKAIVAEEVVEQLALQGFS